MHDAEVALGLQTPLKLPTRAALKPGNEGHWDIISWDKGTNDLRNGLISFYAFQCKLIFIMRARGGQKGLTFSVG